MPNPNHRMSTVHTLCPAPVCRARPTAIFGLYATKSEVGRYTLGPGMRHVATVTLDLPPGWSQSLSSAGQYNLEVRCSHG